MIRLRDQPGVLELELLLFRLGWTEGLEEEADELSHRLFGITPSEAGIVMDEQGVMIGGTLHKPADAAETLNLARAWEAHFEVLKMFRDEAEAYWAKHGWDVTDDEGERLKVMDRLTRPLVCVVEKLHPKAHFSGSVDNWAAQLEADAQRFRPTR